MPSPLLGCEEGLVSDPTFSEDFKKLLEAWIEIEAKARKAFPDKTDEEIYEICSAAMNRALGPIAPIEVVVKKKKES